MDFELFPLCLRLQHRYETSFKTFPSIFLYNTTCGLLTSTSRSSRTFSAFLNNRHFATEPASGGNHLRTKIVDGVYVITLDSPNAKVNSLGSEVSAEFQKVIHEIETNPSINSAVLISAKPGVFVAGADIGMLEKCKTAAEAEAISHGAQIMFDRMEKSRKPIVAAINGVCLGGGLELAMVISLNFANLKWMLNCCSSHIRIRLVIIVSPPRTRRLR